MWPWRLNPNVSNSYGLGSTKSEKGSAPGKGQSPEMILGVRFSPAPLGLEWYDQGDGHRRDLNPDQGGNLPVLTNVAGRKVHGFELIGYLRNGEGVNLLITTDDGSPIGLDLTQS